MHSGKLGHDRGRERPDALSWLLVQEEHAPSIAHAESLNPRAYELAACGAFHLSDSRAEVAEVFGELVPTFSTPTEAAALIRLWLADPAAGARRGTTPGLCGRGVLGRRATRILGDVEALLQLRAA